MAAPGGPYVIDGEICALDPQGRSNFELLRTRASRRRYVPGTQVTFMVFDMMVCNGTDVMRLPLVERKALLKEVLAGVGTTTVLYQSEFPADASLFEAFVMSLKLEGFLAKKRLSTYQPGPERSRDWLKIKRKGAVKPGRFERRSSGWLALLGGFHRGSCLVGGL